MEEYNHIKPSEEAQENHIKKATNVKFFEDWFPEYSQDTDADSESRPRTVNHIDIKVHGSDKQLTIADIDKRAREVNHNAVILVSLLILTFSLLFWDFLYRILWYIYHKKMELYIYNEIPSKKFFNTTMHLFFQFVTTSLTSNCFWVRLVSENVDYY